MQRPLYMQPKDALEYGIIDGIVKSQKKKDGDQIIDHVPRLEEYGRDVSGVMLLALLVQLGQTSCRRVAAKTRHCLTLGMSSGVQGPCAASGWTVRQSHEWGAGS